MAKPTFGCGDAECGCSTGILGDLTFGKGRLTDMGFWEFPCRVCAKAWEDVHPGVMCWPYAETDCAKQTADIQAEFAAEDKLFGEFGHLF